jgi:VWFA-related protein
MPSRPAGLVIRVAAVVVFAGGVFAQDQQRPPIFQSGAELVRVDFVVTDKSDRPVHGLTAEDFVVKEDGKVRPIVAFEAVGAGTPLTGVSGRTGAPPLVAGANPLRQAASTIILVDDFHLTLDQAARLRPPLKNLLTTVGEPSSGLMLVAPVSQISLLAEWPTGAASLVPVVDHIAGKPVDQDVNFPMSDAEALAVARRDNPTIGRVTSRFVAMHPELTPSDAETLAIEHGIQQAHDVRVRRNALYEQAMTCLDWLATRPGRHSLIVVSGGFPTDEDDSKRDDVITRSLRANAPIDFLDARGLSGFRPYQDAQFSASLNRKQDEGPFGRWDDAAGTTALADDTGGIVITNTNDLEKGFRRLLDMMTSYYILAYEPIPHEKRSFHKIKVETRGKGLHIRARRGYFSGAVAGR